MRSIYVLGLGLALTVTACNEPTENQETETATAEPQSPPASKLNSEGTQQLIAVLSDYYKLKDALVATDGTEASVAAESLAKSAASLQMEMVSDSANGSALAPSLDTISKSSLTISQTDPGDVEAMRTAFEKVSDHMYLLLQNAELKNAGVYQQYCPMAFDDKGAYWLSSETEIRNPYFGKMMLSCGEVTDSL